MIWVQFPEIHDKAQSCDLISWHKKFIQLYVMWSSWYFIVLSYVIYPSSNSWNWMWPNWFMKLIHHTSCNILITWDLMKCPCYVAISSIISINYHVNMFIKPYSMSGMLVLWVVCTFNDIVNSWLSKSWLC